MISDGRSLVRQALDELLGRYPMFDLVKIEWGNDDDPDWTPWVLISLGQPSEEFEQTHAWAVWEFAIWKRTGAIHAMWSGAVDDDPIWMPS